MGPASRRSQRSGAGTCDVDLENAPEAAISTRTHDRLFLFALERGFLDSILDRLVVEPFTRTARQLSRFDRWLCEVVLPAREPLGAAGVDDRDE